MFWTLLSGALAGTAVWVFCPVCSVQLESFASVPVREAGYWLTVGALHVEMVHPLRQADQIKIKPRMSFIPLSHVKLVFGEETNVS